MEVFPPNSKASRWSKMGVDHRIGAIRYIRVPSGGLQNGSFRFLQRVPFGFRRECLTAERIRQQRQGFGQGWVLDRFVVQQSLKLFFVFGPGMLDDSVHNPVNISGMVPDQFTDKGARVRTQLSPLPGCCAPREVRFPPAPSLQSQTRQGQTQSRSRSR